ncbi:MAG TPA: hypothetical protein VHI13_18635 [Candidatus Kapabacteria bacterium]|nr:hypothetical protein [Candidatus Kapabacteria bacterium]
MAGRKFHLILVGILTLLSLSLSLISEIPRAISKAPEVVLSVTVANWPIVLTDMHLLWMRVAGILLIVAITIVAQYKQVYKPFMRFEELRGGAFDFIFGPEIDKLHRNLTNSLRFNITQRSNYLRLSRYVLVGRLRQVYHYGYHNEHRDKALRFWYVRLPGYRHAQGVAATAFLSEQAMIADLRNPALGNARLTGWKFELTRDIKLIMSFPLFRWNGDTYTCVGTMNVDVCDEGVVTELLNEGGLRRLTRLAQYFQDCTEYVSLWL